MKSIAVFVSRYSIGKSSPVLCLLDLLASRFQTVDIYVRDAWCLEARELEPENVRLIQLPDSEGGLFKRGVQLLRYGITRHALPPQYDRYLAFDPHGFVLCKSLFPNARPLYYSLELYFRDNFFNLHYPPEVVAAERRRVSDIGGLIIQSEERAQLFRREYGLAPEVPTFYLPVTYLSPSVSRKSRLLREKYAIDDRTRIALHLGGIQEYHSCIELALTFARLSGWALVLHGYHFGSYLEQLRRVLKERQIDNVMISDQIYERIEDLDSLVMSCDVGLAWYNNVSPNFTSAGRSSGKISAYLRFGLPVIANRYPSTVQAIEEVGCGLCVDDFDAIATALLQIERGYHGYAERCRREYEAVYWFEPYREKLLEFIGH